MQMLVSELMCATCPNDLGVALRVMHMGLLLDNCSQVRVLICNSHGVLRLMLGMLCNELVMNRFVVSNLCDLLLRIMPFISLEVIGSVPLLGRAC